MQCTENSPLLTVDRQVRGPTVVGRYFKAAQPATDGDDWFPTGDVASIDKCVVQNKDG